MLHKLSSEAKDLWSNSKEKVLPHHSVYQMIKKNSYRQTTLPWLLGAINNAPQQNHLYCWKLLLLSLCWVSRS